MRGCETNKGDNMRYKTRIGNYKRLKDIKKKYRNFIIGKIPTYMYSKLRKTVTYERRMNMVSCALYNYDNQEVRIDLPDWPNRIEVKVIAGDEVVDFYFTHFLPIHIDTEILCRRLDGAKTQFEYVLEDHDKLIEFIEFSRDNEEVQKAALKDDGLFYLTEYRAYLMTKDEAE